MQNKRRFCGDCKDLRSCGQGCRSELYRRIFGIGCKGNDTGRGAFDPLHSDGSVQTERIMSSVNLGSTKTGINMDAVKLMGEVIKETAVLTKDKVP